LKDKEDKDKINEEKKYISHEHVKQGKDNDEWGNNILL
jgi:hypothetical protein